MKTTEMLECARGKTLKHTRRFVGNSRRESYLPGRPDEVNVSTIGDSDPIYLEHETWSIAVGDLTRCYDTDPETALMDFSQVEVETGSGNNFVDTFEILPVAK